MKNPLIVVGESIHASIPKTGRIMKSLAEAGPDAFNKPSAELSYIKNLIESQASEGADYIAVNLDAFGEDNPQIAVDMMRQYVRMVRRWSKGVPICIDSSDDNVLKAGLKEWFDTNQKVAQPLLNSIKVYTMNNMLPLKKDYDYAFVGLLIDRVSKSHSVEELYRLAKEIFNEAVGRFGFKPEEIFFDSTIFPLAVDMPMEPGQPSYTYKTFEVIKKIKSDPQINGIHFIGGISNCARDLPARKTGICRAYVSKAMEYGLDAVIANPAHHYGSVNPDADLLELVDAYAKMDGSAEKLNKAMMLMAEFCRQCRKTNE
jgi:5-methyltetrahydrofolate corrinoid/iron sulfur protein methyltransferase